MGGSSIIACTDTYSGPTAFSEKETLALANYYETIASKMEAYICFHSAAQMLMYPLGAAKTLLLQFNEKLILISFSGHTNETDLVPNAGDLHEIAKTAVEALIAVNGTSYQYGNAMNTLVKELKSFGSHLNSDIEIFQYVTSGSSRDHMYGHFKTPLVFTYEMRAGIGTESRFILPPQEIYPNSLEIFTSLVTMIEKSRELGYFKPV